MCSSTGGRRNFLTWLTVFSSSRAASTASSAEPHSFLFGLATSCSTIFPPPLVLVAHEELRVLALLVGALLEELREAGEGDVLALEEEALKVQLKRHSISRMYGIIYLFCY